MYDFNQVLIEDKWEVDYYKDGMGLSHDNSDLEKGMKVSWHFTYRLEIETGSLTHSLGIF